MPYQKRLPGGSPVSGVGVVAGVVGDVVAFLSGQLAPELEALGAGELECSGTQAASRKAATTIDSKYSQHRILPPVTVVMPTTDLHSSCLRHWIRTHQRSKLYYETARGSNDVLLRTIMH